MTAKAEIVELLGESRLALPALLNKALIANERAKYVLSVLQMAAAHAATPETEAASLRQDREACGITDSSFDRIVSSSESDGRGQFFIPGAQRLIRLLDRSLIEMIAPLKAAAMQNGYEARLEKLIRNRPALDDDLISGELIAAMTSGRPESGDGIHVFVMDLHKDLNRLQALTASEDIDGAKTYGLLDSDRPLVGAFMAGINQTRPLKFDHPGLDTLALRSGDTLLIQNDIGTTKAHVLIVRVQAREITLSHTDIHAQRLRFFQGLLDSTGIVWEDINSRQAPGIAEDDLFYVAQGRFTGEDEALKQFLTRLGSRLVFLIDWNKARKRLDLLVPNETAIAILKWASDHDFGHRGFLTLGGERLIYDALEQAVKTPLRYGEPLHEMIGTEVARDYLQFVLQLTATALLSGQSEALIRDRLRIELFNHFRSAEHRLLGESVKHAALIVKLAQELRAALRQGRLNENARNAKTCESEADAIVRRTRAMVRRVSGTEIFCQIVETADDAADDIEDAAFFAALVERLPSPVAFPAALLALADLVAEGAETYAATVAAAQNVHKGSAREEFDRFLVAADRLIDVEHATDERERAVTVALVETPLEARNLHLMSGIANHLESAADALLRAGLMLRDQILSQATFA